MLLLPCPPFYENFKRKNKVLRYIRRLCVICRRRREHRIRRASLHPCGLAFSSFSHRNLGMKWITSIIINLSRSFERCSGLTRGCTSYRQDKTSIHASSPRVHAAASYRNSASQCMCAIRAGQGRGAWGGSQESSTLLSGDRVC
jgi:hypothetical protein